MELISSHNNLDFDSIASMLAAARLYPGAKLLLPDTAERNVREYLTLSGLRRRFILWGQVEPAAVTRVILVDVRQRKRLGPVRELAARGVPFHLWDHHPAGEDDLRGELERLEPLGATVTMLAEELRYRGTELTPDEATLFLLGIYEDTGSLTYGSTTARDLTVAAWLLEQGANLDIVRNFIYRPLSTDQQQLLNRLLATRQTEMIHEIPITIAAARSDSYVGDVAVVAHKLRDLENVAVLFVVVEMEKRVHVVARSRLPSVPVGELLALLGGGGHPTAASACVAGMTGEEVVEFLRTTLRDRIVPLATAGDVMATPVRTVREQLTVAEAKRLMLQLDHSGLPVVNEAGELRGIITWRDIDKALQHGYGHAPVKGYMTTSVVSVDAGSPLPAVQEQMLRRGVGRLPVLRDGKLAGIITRGDLLRALYGGKPATWGDLDQPIGRARAASAGAENVKPLLQRQLTRELFTLLAEIGEEARGLAMRAYLVGGMVRDLLLELPTLDLDIVVEGNGIEFGRRLAARWSSELVTHDQFLTAKVTAPGRVPVDIATARTEYYELPAALPTVARGTIAHDLQRRDFTINAMALALAPDRFGELVDPYGGTEDLQQRILRILYPHSFVDDPSRLLRAVLFRRRFGLTLSRDTRRALDAAVRDRVLDTITPTRLRPELIALLELPEPLPAVQLLAADGLLAQLEPGLVLDRQVERVMGRVRETLPPEFRRPARRWLLPLLALLLPLGEAARDRFARRFGFAHHALELAVRGAGWEARLAELGTAASPSEIHAALAGQAAELLALIYLLGDDELGKKLTGYLRSRTRMKTHLSGEALERFGIPRGPRRKELWDELLARRLDGEIVSRADEEAWLQREADRFIGPGGKT